jgi:glycosyltransferase involved in cell wall biosynthesis
MSRIFKKSVGVVIPTYNCREFISDCLESVLSQSYAPEQIVICDDCSKDGTQEVILKYQRDYPNIIESVLHKRNIGIPKNFNSGLRRVNTDYISIVSGDDFWHKDKLKFELLALRENNECRWAYSNSVIADRNGNSIAPFRRKYDGAEGSIIFETLSHQMTLRNWVVEKSLVDSTGLFDEKFFIFEDWDFKIRLSIEAKVVYVNRDLVFYRKHGTGISGSSGDLFFKNMLRIFLKHNKLINSLPREKSNQIKKYHIQGMAFNLDRYLKSYNSKKNFGFITYSFIKYILRHLEKFYRDAKL